MRELSDLASNTLLLCGKGGGRFKAASAEGELESAEIRERESPEARRIEPRGGKRRRSREREKRAKKAGTLARG